MQENPLYGKFRYKGLPFAHQLTILFKDVVVTKDFMWAPSSGILPSTLVGDVNDAYCPCLDGININMEEGPGDSDDVSVGATNEFGDININELVVKQLVAKRVERSASELIVLRRLVKRN